MTKFSILIPHYKTGHMTAYTISQLLKYKGKHEIEIFVVNNNAGDGSEEYLNPFLNDIKYFEYPKDKMQSHGISFDWVLPNVTTEYFITIESDSFPTKEGWLDYYENLINHNIECAGSILRLSGGSYLHPCGAMYRKSVWEEAKKYCDEVEYSYFPNMSNSDGFDCHLMVHDSVLDEFLSNPNEYVKLANNYVGLSREEMIAKRDYYKPVVSPFHNGMGNLQESYSTYGQRNFQSEVTNIILDNRHKLINRMGSEPGQFFSYWMMAMGKNLFPIPTEIKWMPNRGFQQQEYTLMENGFKHLWSVSAYFGSDNPDVHDIVKFKSEMVDKLYNSLPEHQKIKI